MKTSWNDKQGSRARSAWCVLVTADGNVRRFTGSAIPSVCHAVETDRVYAGKWSSSTWEITHAETTACVQWVEDWGTGRVFPQASWEAGYFWLAEKAPLLTREGFEQFVRAECPRHADRWDAAQAAEMEFGFAATEEELSAIREAQERIAAEKVVYESAQAKNRANSPFAALAALKLKGVENA